MMCLNQRCELRPALPVHCKPPTAPPAAGGGVSTGSGTRVAFQDVSHILMDMSLPTDICMLCPHHSNESPTQELAF